MSPGPLALVLAALLAWLAIGTLGLVRARELVFVSRVLFPVGALAGLVLAAAGVIALGAPAQTLVVPLGLPDLPFHLRLDALSAFFLILLGAVGAAISVFSAGYFRSSEGTAQDEVRPVRRHGARGFR